MSATVAAVFLAATGAQAQDSVSNCNVPDGGSFVSALTVTVNGEQQTIRLGERGLTRDIMFNPELARQYVADLFGLTEELQYSSCSGDALIHTSDLPPPPPPPAPAMQPVQPMGPVFFNGFGVMIGSAIGWSWMLCGSPADHGLTANPAETFLVFKYFVPGLGLTNDELSAELLERVTPPTRDNTRNFVFNSDGTQYRPPVRTAMQVSGMLPEEVEGLDVVPDAPDGAMEDGTALPPEPELETDEAPPQDSPETGGPAQDVPAGDTPDTGTPAQDTGAGDVPAPDAPTGDAPIGDGPTGDGPIGDAPALDSPAADTPSGDTLSDGASG